MKEIASQNFKVHQMHIGVVMHQIGSQSPDSITSSVTVGEQSVGTAKSKIQSPYQVVRESTKECVQQFKTTGGQLHLFETTFGRFVHSADETNKNCGRQPELHKTM